MNATVATSTACVLLTIIRYVHPVLSSCVLHIYDHTYCICLKELVMNENILLVGQKKMVTLSITDD